MAADRVDLGELLETEVYPKLSHRDVFTGAHNWKSETKDKLRGDCPWHDSKSGSAFVVSLPSLKWYCSGCQVGGTPIQYLWKLRGNGGTTPTGSDFVDLVRDLCNLARVPFPERERTAEEVERTRKREARRSVLETVCSVAQETLQSTKGKAALSYLEARGFSGETIKDLGFGFYLQGEVRDALKKAGHDPKVVQESAASWKGLNGYVLVPWLDDRGFPLTVYGAWPEKTKTPPDGKPHKTALPNPKDEGGNEWEKTKRSPLYLDRALRAGVQDVVLVEGVFDAALLQTKGDPRAVACVAATLSKEQVETLKSRRVQSVTICLDPDSAGEAGVSSCVRQLTEAGLASYVAPKLPNGLDPDELVLRDGIEKWKAHVAKAIPGAVARGELLLGDVSPGSPTKEREEAVQKVLDLSDSLRDFQAVYREDLLKLASERTGYSFEALSEVAEDLSTKRRREEQERTLDRLLRDATKARQTGDRSTLEVVRDLSKELSKLEGKTEDPPGPFSVEELERESASLPEGRSSGWKALDKLDVRFHPGELSVLGARTGHAKTTALVSLLGNWLEASEEKSEDELFVLYSCEESRVRVFHRLLALLTAKSGEGWTSNEVRDYLRDPGSRDRWPNPDELNKAKERLRSLEGRLFVVYRPTWTITEIESHVLGLADQRTIGAVLVDYLQRVPGPRGSFDRRDIEVSTVARSLAALAKEIRSPVITAAQINREAIPDKFSKRIEEAGGYKDAMAVIREAHPQLHNLREGGSEQEADLVLGLLNYAADYQHEGGDFSKPPEITRLDVGVLKSRYGGVGQWAGLALGRRFGLVRDPQDFEEI